MRRILLAALAVLLLHAAPAMATTCTNLALAGNGGTPSANSTWPNSSVSLINDGIVQNQWQGAWMSGSLYTWPDWAQVEWSTPRAINRIIARGPVWTSDIYWYQRALRRTRIQYWNDTTSAWVDVVGNSDQPNPVIDWTMPVAVADGSESLQFDFATVSTTKIRVFYDEGSTHSGYSWLSELEAYERAGGCVAPGDDPRNLALRGTISASSVHSSGAYPVEGVNNGRRESGTTRGYWNDDTNGSWPDWVQVTWDEPVAVDRIVARIPLARSGFPVGEITLRRTRIQYWDDAGSTWVDVADRNGAPNPVLDWTGPIGAADGSETRLFEFHPVTTTRVRALIEDGSTDGWSWLDELEAYCVICETPRGVNVALPANGGAASASSEYSASWGARYVNNGRRERSSDNYWNDGSSGTWPDWVQVQWRSTRAIDRIVVRGMVWSTNAATGLRTLGRTRIQWYDDFTSRWVDVVGASGQANPILSWTMPVGAADGSETKQFDFPLVTTRRVRALIEQGSTDGWSWLEELEAYRVS